MNIKQMMNFREGWMKFCENHPKFPVFLGNVKAKGAEENMEVAIAIRYPDGTEYKTGIRVQSSDVEFIKSLSSMRG